jgi:hypothetical protein
VSCACVSACARLLARAVTEMTETIQVGTAQENDGVAEDGETAQERTGRDNQPRREVRWPRGRAGGGDGDFGGNRGALNPALTTFL